MLCQIVFFFLAPCLSCFHRVGAHSLSAVGQRLSVPIPGPHGNPNRRSGEGCLELNQARKEMCGSLPSPEALILQTIGFEPIFLDHESQDCCRLHHVCLWGLGFTPNRTSRLDWPAFRRWDRQSFALRPRWWMKQDSNLRTRSFHHGAESAQLLHPS